MPLTTYTAGQVLTASSLNSNLSFAAQSGGLVSAVPTSVAVGSGSATTSTNGQVSFTGVSSVSLNGVFSSAYDNYCFILTPSALSADMNINMRYRVGGVDASGANYTQVDALNSTSSAWGVSTSTGSTVISVGQALESTDPYLYAVQGNIYSPFKAAPTTYFSNAPTYINVAIYRVYLTSGWHSLSTSYDGISFITSTGTMTGTVSVYGYNK
jgi:hypothetical protein